MTIKELIVAAATKSPEFSTKYNYWVIKRKRTPDLPWLMSQLEQTLGKEFVKQAALTEASKED